MGRFILRRLVQAVIVIIGVTTVVFVVTRMVGDPVKVMLPIEATAENRAALESQLGLDQPILTQFGDYLSGAVRLDFGDSLWQRRPAMTIVFEKLPATFLLVFTAFALALIFGIVGGIIASLRPGGWVDRITVSFSLLGLSVPQFWLGLILIVVFAVILQWLPTSGIGSVSKLILPAVTMAAPMAGRIVMITRSSMIDEFNNQHLRNARAKGLGSVRIVGLHAFKGASVAVLTLAGWELIGALAGFSVVVETVFAWPGLGLTAIQAIQRQDLILLQAIVFIVALMVVVINAVIDVIHKLIDPRVTLG
ncbi:MAG: ABC transporter permease [Acidimicrobiia bacterium]|nr:MAG: ABC transporter permease [Acidimicrobiia bacterium]